MSLRETAALLERCQLFIGNDSATHASCCSCRHPRCGNLWTDRRAGSEQQLLARAIRTMESPCARRSSARLPKSIDGRNPSDSLSLKIREISVAAVVKAASDLLRAQRITLAAHTAWTPPGAHQDRPAASHSFHSHMKRTLRVLFTDFWRNFSPADFWLHQLLADDFDVKFDESDPELLIFCDYGINHLKYKCHKIYYSHENTAANPSFCDYSFCFNGTRRESPVLSESCRESNSSANPL